MSRESESFEHRNKIISLRFVCKQSLVGENKHIITETWNYISLRSWALLFHKQRKIIYYIFEPSNIIRHCWIIIMFRMYENLCFTSIETFFGNHRFLWIPLSETPTTHYESIWMSRAQSSTPAMNLDRIKTLFVNMLPE